MPPETPSQAVHAARKGDPQGWDWIFTTYYGLVHRYLSALLGGRGAGAVDDVTQEVFVASVPSIQRLRGDSPSAIEGWLLGIARHKAIDHIRLAVRNERTVAEAAVAVAPGPADPNDLVTSQWDAAILRDALEALSIDQRDVLIRRFVLDQSLDHVAATTGRSVGTVKALQHRGIAAMRRILPAGDGGDA